MFPHSRALAIGFEVRTTLFSVSPLISIADFSGPNSLRTRADNAISNVSTLYLGYRLNHSTEVFFDVEEASGGGLSDGLGLAGFTNLDVVRNPLLSKAPYMARVMVREIIPLSHETVEAQRGIYNLAVSVPVRRLEIRAGKFGTADFFDLNRAGSDSHLQFMNWIRVITTAPMTTPPIPYAGTLTGPMVEYYDRSWTIFGLPRR